MKKIVEVFNVRKQFKVTEIVIEPLNGIYHDIENRDFAVIQGPRGSGKSTLLHIIGWILGN